MSSTARRALEIGGDFPWPAAFPAPFTPWPDQVGWFARGRDSLLIACSNQPRRSATSRLFVPTYFCEEVIEGLVRSGVSIARYVDRPDVAEPEFADLQPNEHDCVLVVNYFGLSERRDFVARVQRETGATVIEDHTHDPVSDWALASSAPYAMASLRKTLPVSDGALLWSPIDGPGCRSESAAPAYSDTRIVAAMAIKATYLASATPDPELKREFRTLLHKGLAALEAPADALAISPWSARILAHGFPARWRQRRAANAVALREGLESRGLGDLLLYRDWPDQHVPFALELRFATSADRDQTRQRLIANDIYPPIHWACPNSPDAAARDLGTRILSLPIDHRYNETDGERIAQVLSQAT